MTRNLDQAERIINNFKQHAYPHAKQVLEKVISKLDKTILKSDMMLFTDMKTEKQLLQASTQFAEAKKLLSKGNHAEASKIVRDVKNMMDSINFKPSDQKIVHYVKGENEALQHRSPTGQLLTKMSDATYQGSEPSPRAMYDMVRSLGLNHESDVANSLVFHKNDCIRARTATAKFKINLNEINARGRGSIKSGPTSRTSVNESYRTTIIK